MTVHKQWVMSHDDSVNTCAGEMLTPKSSLNSRARLCSGTPPPAKKLKNLNNINKEIQ